MLHIVWNDSIGKFEAWQERQGGWRYIMAAGGTKTRQWDSREEARTWAIDNWYTIAQCSPV